MPAVTPRRPIHWKRRLKRQFAYRTAYLVHLVTLAYLDLYGEDDPEPDSGSDSGTDKQHLDLRGTTGGQFEVATNREHQVIEIIGRQPFGFGAPDRRAEW